MEREVTGLYLSGHPIDAFAGEVKRLGAVPIGRLNAAFGGDEPPSGERGFEDGDMVTLCGVIGQVKTKTTRNNSLMAYVTLEDATGAIELLVFARVLEQAGPYCRAGVLVTVRGKLSEREEKAPQVLAESIRPLSAELETADNLLPGAEGKTLYLKLPDSHSRFAKGVLPMLKEFPGPNRVVLYYADTEKRVAGTAALDTRLLERLRRGLGEENVVVK
jgi:DNA polymerase-3 subunit alpha